jgi:uncharacterized membrane protein YjjP (DUF1212 family)
MTSSLENNLAASSASSSSLNESLDELLRFGAMMLRAGSTAFQARRSMDKLARSMGLDSVSVQFELGTLIGTARRDGQMTTLVREVGRPGVNTQRISRLEKLAQSAVPGLSARELEAALSTIDQLPPRYSMIQTGVAVGAACGAFAVLNGGIGLEVLAATIGGVIGQVLRTILLRRHYNHYAVTALCALVASGLYTLLALSFLYAGFGVPRHTIGFISSVLFLVPGFPMIAGLLDMLQYEMTASLTRLAYASMLMLAAALGLSAVIEVVGFSLESPPARVLPEPWLFLLRVAASFVAGGGFAILFNTSLRTAVIVGLLSIAGNAARLLLRDAGLGLPLATFVGAFVVGLAAALALRWLDQPRISLTVPGVIMMVPGLYAFDALVLFNHGQIMDALAATILFGFVIGAMAMGLAAARFVTETEWLKD